MNSLTARSAMLRVSELFESLQGEGPSLGTPAVFLRLAGCNLACRWCDTEYSWNFQRYDPRTHVSVKSVQELAEDIAARRKPLLVITGGEPLLQQSPLRQLLVALPEQLRIELETNATLLPHPEIFARVQQFNLSPKLAHSGEPVARRQCLEVLRALRQHPEAWLKLVVEAPGDLAEVEVLVQQLGWPPHRIVLMPEGTEASVLRERAGWLTEHCIARGYRFSPRLHVELWGNRRGV